MKTVDKRETTKKSVNYKENNSDSEDEVDICPKDQNVNETNEAKTLNLKKQYTRMVENGKRDDWEIDFSKNNPKVNKKEDEPRI